MQRKITIVIAIVLGVSIGLVVLYKVQNQMLQKKILKKEEYMKQVEMQMTTQRLREEQQKMKENALYMSSLDIFDIRLTVGADSAVLSLYCSDGKSCR